MDKHLLAPLFLILSITTISACAPMNKNDERTAICNELSSKMMFSSGTSNARKAEIQDSEDLLRQRQYEKYHCDER